MQTLRIPYEIAEWNELTVLEYRRQFSICVRSAYKRLKDGYSSKEVYAYLKGLNNIELMNSVILNSAIMKARGILNNEISLLEFYGNKLETLKRKVDSISRDSRRRTSDDDRLVRRYLRAKSTSHNFVFGGRQIFKDLRDGKISKDEFLDRRYGCFEVYGISNGYGNQAFGISIFKTAVLFRPNRSTNIAFNFIGLSKRQKELIDKLYDIQERKGMPITYKFNGKYIYIVFDEKILYGITRNDKIDNRVLAIDQNPNYIGWSIVDWDLNEGYKIIRSGVFSCKKINDTGLHCEKSESGKVRDKRIYEHYHIAKKLVDIGIAYRCGIFGIENLIFKGSDSKNYGKTFRILVNKMWNRSRFSDCLKKRCHAYDFKFIEVPSQFSSKFGNVLYRKHGLPDMVNASIEIGRRAYEFNCQYIENTKEQGKTIIHPNLTHFDDVIVKSMEEFGITEDCADLYELFGVLAKRKKNSEMLYRVPLSSTNARWFKSSSNKSLVYQCEYDLHSEINLQLRVASNKNSSQKPPRTSQEREEGHSGMVLHLRPTDAL